jgi:hypothetical protein
MSSGSRRGASEENILAMLERDAARRRMAGNPRFAMYAIAGSVALSLVGALAWLLHENNNANEMLRLPDQPGVSVTVVPDKPAGAPVLPVAEPGLQSAAATIVDYPEPALHKVAETQPVNKIAQAEPPASKSALAPQPAVQKAHDDVPPLVLLKPEEAKSAAARKPASTPARTDATKPAASAPALTEPARQAASTPAHSDTARHSASAAAHEAAATHGPAPARVATAATKKSSPARDEARRVAARQRAADADQPARSSRAGAQPKPAAHARTEALASASAHPRAASQTRTKKVPATAEKKAESAVDTDVALISAIIMHADGRTDKKAAAKP